MVRVVQCFSFIEGMEERVISKKVKNMIINLLLLYSILFMTLSYTTIKAKAGDINKTEEALLSFLSQVFEWEGKEYIIKSEYIGKARNYLSKDEVDIQESEKEGLFSLFYENITVGIQKGYLIENISDDSKSEETSQEDIESNASYETSQEDIESNASSETSQEDIKVNDIVEFNGISADIIYISPFISYRDRKRKRS